MSDIDWLYVNFCSFDVGDGPSKKNIFVKTCCPTFCNWCVKQRLSYAETEVKLQHLFTKIGKKRAVPYTGPC